MLTNGKYFGKKCFYNNSYLWFHYFFFKWWQWSQVIHNIYPIPLTGNFQLFKTQLKDWTLHVPIAFCFFSAHVKFDVWTRPNLYSKMVKILLTIFSMLVILILVFRLPFWYFSVDTLKQQLLARGEDLVWDKVSLFWWSSKFVCLGYFENSTLPPPPPSPGHWNIWKLEYSNSRLPGPKSHSNAVPLSNPRPLHNDKFSASINRSLVMLYKCCIN